MAVRWRDHLKVGNDGWLAAAEEEEEEEESKEGGVAAYSTIQAVLAVAPNVFLITRREIAHGKLMRRRTNERVSAGGEPDWRFN